MWPTWFIDDQFPATEGPFTTEVAGVPQKTRDGVTPRSESSFERVKLPSCADCNAELNRRFEVSAKPIVRELMASNGQVSLVAGEVQTLGLWLLKTWLLLAHPLAIGSHPGAAPRRWRLEEVSHDLYGWMVNGGPPPDGLSLWVAHEERGGSTPQTRRIPLPTVEADGRVIAFQVFRCAVRFLDVTLAYHPGWEIDHPLEVEGRAARLWPLSARGVDFAALPPVSPRDTVWAAGPRLHFAPGTYGSVELPPLSAEWDPMFVALPGVVFAAAPSLGG